MLDGRELELLEERITQILCSMDGLDIDATDKEVLCTPEFHLTVFDICRLERCGRCTLKH